MKRIMLQLMRTIVTIIVVGTMALMIFALRGERASLRRQIDSLTERQSTSVLETIHARTSIRQFDANRPVSDEAVEKILRAAMCAPSAMNKQPWEFVVIREKTKLAALAKALPFCRVGNGAQVAIVACGNLDNGLDGRGKEYWIQDCSAASMNILLAVKALGLGAVWTGVYPGEDRVAAVRRILDIPNGYMPLNIIPIGYPAESPTPKDKWNKGKIHLNQW